MKTIRQSLIASSLSARLRHSPPPAPRLSPLLRAVHLAAQLAPASSCGRSTGVGHHLMCQPLTSMASTTGFVLVGAL